MSVQPELLLEYDLLPLNHPMRLRVLLRLVGALTLDTGNRRKMNVGLVIDRSGSMAGDKMRYTKLAADMLVNNLSAQDILSVVQYDDRIEVLLPPEYVTRKDVVKQAIHRLEARGSTNLSGGWLEGCRQVDSRRADDLTNRVMLISDGQANQGIVDIEKLTALAEEKYKLGIATTTMGLGKDYNEDLMSAIARAGGGAYYFIESPESLPAIFQEELNGLLGVVAQNITAEVRGEADGVKFIGQMNDYPSEKTAHGLLIRMGDAYAEEVKAVVLEFDIPAVAEAGQRTLATITLRWDDLIQIGAAREISLNVSADFSGDVTSPQKQNPGVTEAALLLEAARAREEAIRQADRGNMTGASSSTRSVTQSMRDFAGKSTTSAMFKRTMDDLDSETQEMDETGDMPAFLRKKMSNAAHQQKYSSNEKQERLRKIEDEAANQAPKTPVVADEKFADAHFDINDSNVDTDLDDFQIDDDDLDIESQP